MPRPSAGPSSSRKPPWKTPGLSNLQFPSAHKTLSLFSLPVPFPVVSYTLACQRPGLDKVVLSSFTASFHHCHMPDPLYRCTLVSTQRGLPSSLALQQ